MKENTGGGPTHDLPISKMVSFIFFPPQVNVSFYQTSSVIVRFNILSSLCTKTWQERVILKEMLHTA